MKAHLERGASEIAGDEANWFFYHRISGSMLIFLGTVALLLTLA